MKWTNIMAFLAKTFGMGKSVVKTNEEQTELTLTDEQSTQIDAALEKLSGLEAENESLQAQIEEKDQELLAKGEEIKRLQDEIASRPSRSGEDAAADDDIKENPHQFGPGHPLYTSVDAEISSIRESWKK